jgi:hypothetical protein
MIVPSESEGEQKCNAATMWGYIGGENRGKPRCGSSSMVTLLNLRALMTIFSSINMAFTDLLYLMWFINILNTAICTKASHVSNALIVITNIS